MREGGRNGARERGKYGGRVSDRDRKRGREGWRRIRGTANLEESVGREGVRKGSGEAERTLGHQEDKERESGINRSEERSWLQHYESRSCGCSFLEVELCIVVTIFFLGKCYLTTRTERNGPPRKNIMTLHRDS